MGIDTGKLAKRMGRMSPKHAKHIDQDPIHVPPHKKPRTYRLTVAYERVSVTTHTKEFTSKVAMQEFRGRVERALAEQAKADAERKPRRYSYYTGLWNLKMHDQETQSFKSGPTITEEMIEGSASNTEGSRHD